METYKLSYYLILNILNCIFEALILLLMNISFNWLSEFLKIDLSIEEVSNILTDIGLEVEGIENYEQYKGGLDGLVVGEVVYCDQHPNGSVLKEKIRTEAVNLRMVKREDEQDITDFSE